MRTNSCIATLACLAPSLAGVQAFSTPPSLIRPGRILSFPSATRPSTRQFSSSSSKDTTNNNPVVQNDTSSFGGEQLPIYNMTELEAARDVDMNYTKSAEADNETHRVAPDPSGAGDQIAKSMNDTTATSSSNVIPPLPETLDASGLLSINPELIDIVQVPAPEVSTANGQQAPNLERMLQGLPFVSMFRGSANYIANHRNTLAVYHIPGGLLDLPDPTVFQDLMNDIALTWLLGMKIVLVVGCRHQIEKRIPHEDRPQHMGIPLTDADTLRIVKEEAGFVRFETERQLARSLRLQGGISYGSGGKTQKAYVEGNVVSGNFYSAQPFGILDGVDYKYTGFVRKVEVEKIRQLHANKDICLLTTLGVSPSGEVFNVNSESLAAIVAGAMDASKVIYFTESEMELKHKIHGTRIQNLRFTDARHLLEYNNVQIHRRGFVTVGNDTNVNVPETDMLIKIGWSMMALEGGVKRAHIISPKFGAVLQELYTRDGSGALISRDLYEGIRRANVNDVSSIHDLISPLIKMGTLVDRPKSVLEKDVDSYYIYTRDNLIVACGQLKIFEGAKDKRYAEIGCLVVNKQYRAAGRGDAMLGYLERLCFLNGATTVFVLSTQTMEWFVERGFRQVSVEELPPSRQATYNHKRASKIYMKDITSSRDLDQSELWWNR